MISAENDHITVLRCLADCADSWESQVRLIGNLTAAEIVEACKQAITDHSALAVQTARAEKAEAHIEKLLPARELLVRATAAEATIKQLVCSRDEMQDRAEKAEAESAKWERVARKLARECAAAVKWKRIDSSEDWERKAQQEIDRVEAEAPQRLL